MAEAHWRQDDSVACASVGRDSDTAAAAADCVVAYAFAANSGAERLATEMSEGLRDEIASAPLIQVHRTVLAAALDVVSRCTQGVG